MYNLPTIATVNTNKKQQTAAHWTYMTRLRRWALHLPSVYVLARTLSLGRAFQGAATPGTPWPRRRLRASSLASPTHCSRRWTPPTHSDRQRSTDSSDLQLLCSIVTKQKSEIRSHRCKNNLLGLTHRLELTNSEMFVGFSFV